MLKDKKTGFIGGGNMAEAIIKGLLAGGVAAADLTVAEPFPQRRDYLAERYGITTIADNVELCQASDTIIIAVKPQVSNAVFSTIENVVGVNKLVISIMAGVRTAAVEGALTQGARVVRVMPNTPALVLEGASALCRGANASDDDVVLTRHIFELIGTACVVDEKYMDAVTGLSGSGPAYVLTFIEALADAGVKQGLTRDTATALAAQTVLGSAKLLLETREHPAVLRGNVTSPGGTTIAGMYALEKEGFRGAVMDAVEAATARSIELGAK
ncbi:pyrroline-5-carboxylate reductase [Geomesophilobacter sediminis]|uniref:Pyrroline-5-carboxylate reductase n=1 Tax=Geomesophilobacter sediminis TaxID=2798584 RepID=A0A8J7M4R5_9BACT|nr:pyrroline-5-carboxylate reductase [Geomesophilobacter sediminis]MBJ6727938.1 pyrroline-5-carboxylate reductase [Geomesophilobacter sediminis]